MKTKITVVAVVAAMVAIAAFAQSSDQPVASITTVANVANCAGPYFNRSMSVQPRTNAAHVGKASLPDGGGADVVATDHVLVNQNVLFDMKTTTSQPYICVFGVDGGAVTAKVYDRGL